MFLIRNARLSDLGDMLRLSRELQTVNLPTHKADLKRMLERSTQSFSGQWNRMSGHAQYVFVLEDCKKKRVVGTSKVFARHGTPQKPHIYFQVMHEKVSSKTLKLKFNRKFYRLKADQRGYSEIGGLVLSATYRRRKEQLGRQLSFVRFLYMKAHPTRFLRRVIAELLPPLKKGQSSLWNFYGHKLTQLPYRKADLLSYKDKEFILRLFPHTDLYHDVLPAEVQAVMGQTGPGSSAARKLLEQIGFEYAEQIDPFDGGPHYVARRSDIEVYRKTNCYRFAGSKKITSGNRLLMVDVDDGMRAIASASKLEGNQLFLPQVTTDLLELRTGQVVYGYRMRS